MTALPQPILVLVERFAHFFQRMTGITPMKIALVGDTLAGVCFIATLAIPDVSMGSKIYAAVMGLGLMYMTVMIYPRIESEITKNAANGLVNNQKVNMISILLRLMFSVMVIQQVYGLFTVSSSFQHVNDALISLGFWIALYFMACDPLPPAESKLSKFFASITPSSKKLVPRKIT